MSRTEDRNPNDRDTERRHNPAGPSAKKIDTATEAVCANCGMTQDEWKTPAGFQDEGQTYCCEGCAVGAGCTC